MNKRGAGAVFCLISGLLFATRYLVAAIFMSNVASWSNELFEAGLMHQGNGLRHMSIICLAVGVAYLVWAEIEERSRR